MYSPWLTGDGDEARWGCSLNLFPSPAVLGVLVIRLSQDYKDYAEIDKQLEKMGYNIRTRHVKELLAKSSLGRCADSKNVEVITRWVGRVLHALLLWADFNCLGWTRVVPEHCIKYHPRVTATADIANDGTIDRCGWAPSTGHNQSLGSWVKPTRSYAPVSVELNSVPLVLFSRRLEWVYSRFTLVGAG